MKNSRMIPKGGTCVHLNRMRYLVNIFDSHGIGVDVKCGKWRWFLLTAHSSHKEEHEVEQHSRSFIPQRYQWVDTHRASRWHPAGEKTDQQEQHNNGEERQRIVRRNSPELIGQYSGDRKAGG
jgi:hypothetical protein